MNLKKFSKKDNKFMETAKALLEFVGKDNFTQVASCFSRVRFRIIDKTKVNEQAIDELKLVKAHLYNGNELQIIIEFANSAKIAQNITELKEEKEVDFQTKKSSNELNAKESWWKRFSSAVNGIVVPIIPLLFMSGFLMGINQILSASGLIKTFGMNQLPSDLDMWSFLMFILSNSSLALLSIFFCYSTVKYFNGNPVMGIFIGLLIASRYFISPVEEYPGIVNYHKWLLFKIGSNEINLQPYNNSIIPAVGLSIIYVYLDRFIKKWMPGPVDLLFRPILGIVIVFFLGFFILLPILGIIELGLTEAIKLFFKIPYGIGGGIIGFFWYPLVFLGVSWTASLALDYNFLHGIEPVLRGYLIYNAGGLATIGTMLALMVKEKNLKTRTTLLAPTTSLLFSIGEPTIYGVLIQKPKVFWLTNLGRAVVGFLIVGLGVTQQRLVGSGILAFLGNIGQWRNIGFYYGIAFFGLILNFMIISFFYREKQSEVKLIKHSLNKMISYVWWTNYKSQNEDNKKSSWFKLKKELIIDQELLFLKKENILYYKTFKKLNKLNFTLEKKKIKLANKLSEMKERIVNIQSKNSYDSLIKKMNKYENKMILLIENLTNEVSILNKNFNSQRKELNEVNQEVFLKIIPVVQSFLKKYAAEAYSKEMENKIWNAINNNLIITEQIDAKPVEISKADYYQTNNKYLLKFLPKTI